MARDEMGKGNPWTEWEHYRPLGAIIATFLAVIAWLVFILLFALYWSSSYSAFQDAIVTIVTLVIMGLFIGLVWTVWGMRRFRNWKKSDPPASTG
jgi:chromate transport protein ChrA